MSQYLQAQAFDLVLPWEEDAAQEEKFKRLLKRALALFLLLLLILSFMPQIETVYEEPEDAVVKTKIILEPKVVEVPRVEEKPKVVEREKPKPKELPRPKAEAPAVAATPEETKEDFVAAQGLEGLSSQLGSLRSSLDLTRLQNKNVSTSNAGQVEHSAKQVLGKDAQTRVGTGIEVDDADMRAEAVALAEHNSLVVEGVLPGGAPGGSSRAAYGSYKAGLRDMESIRRTLEHTKSRVYAMYQKALQENPDLAGKFTFKLVIEPSGEVSQLVLISSELGLEQLEQNILEKIRQVNFGAKEVAATSVEYKFVFLPS